MGRIRKRPPCNGFEPPIFKHDRSLDDLEESFWRASGERLVNLAKSILPNDDTCRIRHRNQVRQAVCRQLMDRELAKKFLKVHEKRKTITNKKFGIGIPDDNTFILKNKEVGQE
jgi:hypothetical protein